jgi:hypothetical protein
MIRRFGAALTATMLAALIAASASSAFGLKALSVKIVGPDETTPSMQAGTHPFAVKTEFDVETEVDPEFGEIPAGQLREASGELPPGLTGSPFAVPQCLGVDFATIVEKVSGIEQPNCSDGSVLGLVEVKVALGNGELITLDTPLYNLAPPPGVAAKLGFKPYKSAPVTFDLGVKDTPPYNVVFSATNVTQVVRVLSTHVTIWGNPSDPAHDEKRGTCGLVLVTPHETLKTEGIVCSAEPSPPFLTLPRSCTGPLLFSFDAISWQDEEFHGIFETEGIGRCDRVLFGPTISSRPTTTQAESPSGLDFNLDVPENPGLTDPEGTSRSDLEKAVVTLPKGVKINPSQAEGLAVCSEADFEREKAGSAFGAGCPAASKIGTTEVETPL